MRSTSLLLAAILWTGAGYAAQKAEQGLVKSAKSEAQDQKQFDQAIKFVNQKEPLRALSIFNSLLRQKSSSIGSDILQMDIGRIYFQMGDLDRAIEAYEGISKKSEFWLEAQEERAHAYGRQKNYDKVISVLTTVMSPVFDGEIGPEPYFVAGITYFKICDYGAIFKISDQYKTRFKPRVHALAELLNKGTSPQLETVLNRLDQKDYTLQTVSSEGRVLPRNFLRDGLIKTRIADRKLALKNGEATKADALRRLTVSRMMELTKLELNEIQDTTQKLNILEAEIIQRIHNFENNKNRPVQGDLAKSSANVLTFPVNDESWIDELDSFRAQVKGCPESKKRNL